MKIYMKKFVVSVLSIFLFVFCMTSLSACAKMDRYLSVVPTDQDYKATMTYTNTSSIGSDTKNWTVIRKSATICGEERDVIYIEYSYIDNDNDYYNYDRTLLYVNGNVLRLVDDAWQPYTGSFGDKWSDIYGSYSKPGSFVYELTQSINGRDFPQSKRVKKTDYIEYDFGEDNEVFRISNNEYHVLLYYSFDYGTSSVRQEASFTFGTPTDTIEHLSTITPDMIEDE